jgi:hypothetical protein
LREAPPPPHTAGTIFHLAARSAPKVPVRRTPRELQRKLNKINLIPRLETWLPNAVLLRVMLAAQADRPFVGGLQAPSAVSAAANVRALDRKPVAPGDGTMMPPHPCPVRRK